MGQSRWERFIEWICKKFGHKKSKYSWVFEGRHFDSCKRCGIVYELNKGE